MSDDQYNDDDLVYVDPEMRSVIGKVEWRSNGDPVSRKYVVPQGGKRFWRIFYPWGTFRAMKSSFRVGLSSGGKGEKHSEEQRTSLDEVIPRFINDTF